MTLASSGEEALNLLDQGLAPRVILLDILLPGLNGLAVLSRLKAQASTKDVPVVMISALAQENIVLQGVRLGAKDYIRKPFHPKMLLSRVEPFIRDPK